MIDLNGVYWGPNKILYQDLYIFIRLKILRLGLIRKLTKYNGPILCIYMLTDNYNIYWFKDIS